MLSRNELGRFGSGMLTDVFIDRLRDKMLRGANCLMDKESPLKYGNSDKLGKH